MNRKEYFDDYLSTHFSRNAGQDDKRDGLEFATFDKNFGPVLPKSKNAKILEIGFGTGFFLKYLVKNGYTNVKGIELSAEETDYVRVNVYSEVEAVETTEGYLAEHLKEYDFIVMLDVLEHIPKTDTINFLRCIHASLADGGQLLVRVPNGSNPLNIQMFVCDFTHEFIYSTESLRQVNSLARFSKSEVRPFKEEGMSTHGRITNVTQPIMFFLLRMLMGLNRSYQNNESFYTRTIFCISKK